MASAFDSRKFSTPRLRSAHGYEDEPVVDDGLAFRLPRFSEYHSRIIQRNGLKWMIWSPNSRQDPFYPGAVIHLTPLPLPTEKEQLRLDGHGGRWDYTRTPQHYSKARPWLAFIVRPGFQEPFDVEYDEVYSVWESTSQEGGRIPADACQALIERNELLEKQILSLLPEAAKIQDGFVGRRPRYPNQSALEGLMNVDRYEKLLDRMTECQRGIKEKAAWVTFVRMWTVNPPSKGFDSNDAVIRAEEKYVGVWLNGEHPEFGWWFLTRAAVPCFIINRLGNSVPATAQCSTFTERTHVDRLRSPYYEYDRVALASGVQVTQLEVGYLRPELPERNGLDLARSSLRWQLKLPNLCALPFTKGLEIRESTPPLADTTFETPPPDQIRETARLPEIGRDEPKLPPAIAPAAKAQGSWIVFAETDPQEGDPGFEEGRTVMLERGKNRKGKGELEEEEEMWYCRVWKRKLIFNDLPRIEEEYADDPEYGRPVPAMKFWHPGSGHGKWLKREPSTWMYQKEKPDLHRVGEIFMPRRFAAAVEEDVEMTTVTEASKVAARSPSLNSSDGRVSLGSLSPPAAQPTEIEEASMDAEAPPPSGSDIVMEEMDASRAMEGVEASRPEPPFTDDNGRPPSLYVRAMGNSLNFLTEDMVRWVGIGRMRRVRRMWRIVVRGYTVDFVLEMEDTEGATLIVREARADSKFRNNARFLDQEEMTMATRGLAEQLALLPLSRHVAPARAESRRERSWDDRPISTPRGRSYSSSGYSRSPSPRRGTKRNHSPSPERGRGLRPRRFSPPRPPFIPPRPQPPPSTLNWNSLYSNQPRTSPEAPRAMRLAKPLPPPPPPVPYATRPNLAAIPVSNAPAVPFNTGVPSLLRRMEETPLSETSSLLDRLRSPQTQDRNLMRRVDVKLEERISVNAQPKRRRPHKRTHKRINKLVDVEMQGFMPQQETFPWTDAEIDFFIDQEEGPPLPDEMYEPYGDFYDTDDEE